VLRVRRGAFVLRSVYDDLDPAGQYRLRVLAVLRSRPDWDAASHHAALAVHGVPMFGVSYDRIDIASVVTKVRGRAGVVTHPAPRCAVTLVGGARALTLAVALVQTAAASGVTAGVCSMDAALHDRLVDLDSLAAALDHLPGQLQPRAAAALRCVDPDCESVGETRTRLLLTDLGFAVRSQVVIRDAQGFVGRVDFLVEDVVVVEFDGLVKYDGVEGKAALAAEKVRESRLVAAGYQVVRLMWSDVERPAYVAREMRAARDRARRWVSRA
jgi:very-short-patch-repair endonuclease